MTNLYSIRRYAISLTSIELSRVLLFFSSKRWKRCKKEGLYRFENSSVYFLVTKDDSEIYIDIWGEGYLGAIFSTIGKNIPPLMQQYYSNITDEFLEFLDQNSIIYREGITQIIAEPFISRIISIIIVSLLCSLMVILFGYLVK